jgi:rSAM/selenodomain-associated transferase 2
MKVSVIIPALNEADDIADTIRSVYARSESCLLEEIIVADGGSTDQTARRAEQAGARVIRSPKKGRAVQMNYGAGQATGDVLYFLHADSIPPPGFLQSIYETVHSNIPAGCFRLAFNHDHPLLKLYAWFTRFDVDAFRFGDQSLFITRDLFNDIGGFREDHCVMEDNEMVRRIKSRQSFTVLPATVTTSARKYLDVGVIKLQLIFTLIYFGYYAGASQSTLVTLYHRLIK